MKIIASLLLFGILVCAFAFLPSRAAQSDYEQLKTAAEKFYAEKSFRKANELYAQAKALPLSTVEARWVALRLADTEWRAQDATQTSDSTKYDEARQQLEALIRDIQRAEERDAVWVEAQESLADFWWLRRSSRNWHSGWQHYHQALDYWAGSSQIERARARYLQIVWKIARPAWAEDYYYYGYHGNYAPPEVLQNALKIAETANDKAHAHYLLAMTWRSQGGWEQRQRVAEEFEAALAVGRANDWYDDALYFYAETMMQYGRVTQDERGNWRQQPDYLKALELFRRLTREYQKGETRYFDPATSQIASIIKPSLGVGVGNIFLPDSEIQFHLNWRNLKRVDLTLSKVDLTRDLRFVGRNDSPANWLPYISRGETVRAWTKETSDQGDYRPGAELVRLEGKLSAGAYLLEASGDGATARDLILVSDVSLVIKTTARRAVAYFCKVQDGAPVSGATVKLWERYYENGNYVWREFTQKSNEDGIAAFDVSGAKNQGHTEFFIAASSDDRQAFATSHGYAPGSHHGSWRIYAFTDRPAYRPNETVQWKFVARAYQGETLTTPANQTLHYQITDPKGAKVGEGKAKLNAFGSLWGTLELEETMPLGEYRVSFRQESENGNHIGDAMLFRLEEYKLPEFKVAVQTPETDGKKATFKLGESVTVNIQADYYFGGAVANANVEVIVYQSPFYQQWRPRREYGWYYDDYESNYSPYGRGQQVKREIVKTDASGKAQLTFETPRNAGMDLQYRIEARVTDSSRREVIGSDSVRVTRQRYYVYEHPAHYLYRPQDRVSINIKALDANDQPVEVEGRVKVTRDYWYEIWLDPTGKEVRGDELRRLKAASRVFPPAEGWRLKFQGYERDDITTQTVKTDKAGDAEFAFTPAREGYYRVQWTSEDKGASNITAETTVWVATTATTDVGYRYGGVQIIVDKETLRVGQRAPVMIVAPTNDRFVLFGVETAELLSYQLIRLSGNVKLIELPIGEEHVPNVFLSAAMVSDRQVFVDTKEVVVPPEKHFLNVEVKADREEYQPRDEGTLTVTAKDHEGKPVAAEIALGLVDSSVFYIQQDYAGDPRQFYYGNKRQHQVQTQSTFQHRQYQRLVEGSNQQLLDDRLLGGQRGKDAPLERLQLQSGMQDAAGAARSEAVTVTESRQRSDERDSSAKIGGAALPLNGRRFQNLATLAPGVAEKEKKAGNEPAEPAVRVRNDFRSTVLWQPDVVTDRNGRAVVKVKYPDSLTTWKATARVASASNQFGIADTAARTKQPLIIRLQAPRFFVVGDTVTLSAVINNNTGQPLQVMPALLCEGITVTGFIKDGKAVKGEVAPLTVAANGEARIDWLADVQQAGAVKVKMSGRGGKYADAMVKTFVAYEHGIEKFVAKSGKLRGDDVTIKLDIPKARKADSTQLTVQVTPSMAVTMLDALPYLIDYPYGCTEQTMSRFLPAAITRKTLADLGLKPESVMGKLFGGIEPQHAARTHTRPPQDLRQLDDMVAKGLERLYDFQHADGGWGWWKEGESDHFMTAYVVWGLTLARQAGVEIKAGVLERGGEFLLQEIVEEETHYDMQAWMLHALAAVHAAEKRESIAPFAAKAFDNLWTNRERLNAYTRALLALAAHQFKQSERAKTLVENLENGVKIDRAPDTSIIQRSRQSSDESVIATAHWGEDGIYWRWSDGGVEATAFALRAMLAIDPQNQLIEPVTNWLIKNRRGAQWSNTRDTAIAVLTFNDYLRQSGELKAELDYDLSVNGQLVATRRVTPEDVFSAPSQFAIERRLLRDGINDIRIVRKRGASPIYFAANAEFFSLEEPVTEAGNEIFVRREYYKLVARPTLLKGYVYERLPLRDGESVMSGERVETVLIIEAKNNYDYLLFEDLKPAGLEAVEVRSGERLYARELKAGAVARKFASREAKTPEEAAKERARREANLASADGANYTGRSRWVYQELRDRKVAMFIDHLPEGVWELRYEMRAETPGAFHALPVLGHAMYVPEIRANGSETRLRVEDKP